MTISDPTAYSRPTLVNLEDWTIVYRTPPLNSRPALFLDRDGVVIEDMDYISKADDVRLIDGVRQTIDQFRAAGHAIVIVTNQSGVARGYFERSDYLAVEARIKALLNDSGPDAVYACPFHVNGKPPFDVNHPWRKPGDGMLRTAAERLSIDLSKSVMVGDRLSDIEAGLSAGLRGVVHVLTGIGTRERQKVDRLIADGSKCRQRIHLTTSIADIPAVCGL